MTFKEMAHYLGVELIDATTAVYTTVYDLEEQQVLIDILKDLEAPGAREQLYKITNDKYLPSFAILENLIFKLRYDTSALNKDDYIRWFNSVKLAITSLQDTCGKDFQTKMILVAQQQGLRQPPLPYLHTKEVGEA